MGQSVDCLTPFGYLPRTPGQGNTISLTRGRSPSVDNNTHIPEDRPRGPCTLVSLTSVMSSLDHLRGVLTASRDGCFSCAWLQLHHSHHWDSYRVLVYAVFGWRPQMSLDSSTLMSLFKGPKQVMSLVISGFHWRQCSEAPIVLRYRFMIDAPYCTTKTLNLH